MKDGDAKVRLEHGKQNPVAVENVEDRTYCHHRHKRGRKRELRFGGEESFLRPFVLKLGAMEGFRAAAVDTAKDVIDERVGEEIDAFALV